jgi:hypothetical protein
VLSDHERETLRAVQRQFVTEDPGFARSFDTVGSRDSRYSFEWAYDLPRWMYTTALVVTVALGLLMLLVRAPATAFLFAAVATTIAVLRRRPDDAPGRDG